MSFVHLHVHSEYSLLDGACKIKESVKKAKNVGMTALAITDHGVMNGCIDFYKECLAQGIKPIIGCEVYMAPRNRFDKARELDTGYYHLILLCKNIQGYQNLISLVSKGFTEGFYMKPRIDFDLLSEFGEGLIVLSACLAGEIPSLLLTGDYETALSAAKRFQKRFGDDFYLEVQDHNMIEQKAVNDGLVRMSKELNIPLVATNDAHYINKTDAKTQKVLMCIQMGKTVTDENAMAFPTDEFYLKTEEEMRQVFSHIPSSIDISGEIAEKCEMSFEFHKLHLPVFQLPEGRTGFEELTFLCQNGMKERYETVTNEMKERLSYELETIKNMGFVDYFLIVQDFINYAKRHKIPVGPGRGSAAGSLVSYALKITDVDPLKYNLLFERFLNPERVSMPDIDIDFCYERRNEVIDYVIRKHGADRVAQIITFGTMQSRLAIRDVGRALGIPYNEVDIIAKLIPFEKDMTIEKSINQVPELKEAFDTNPKINELIKTALTLEGMPRHSSTHAAGVVITASPVSDYVPLQKNDEALVTQYPMGTLEELGLLKMDFLALRNLTIIDDTVKIIRGQGRDFILEKISYEDKDVFQMLTKGKTSGVFQLESPGMRRAIMGLEPKSMEDIIAVISLYRPGPMDSIPMYIENSHHPERVTYKHPFLKEILEVTYGCIVYQEQVMQIVRRLAGYSYGRADLVRRAMSKKKVSVMEKEREYFVFGMKDEQGNQLIAGAVNNGVDEKTAGQIFDEMAKFAEYAFNKSHAAAYAMISYQTAFLKKHYTKEYMAALLTSVLGRTEKVNEYIEECNELKIKVLPPDINESYDTFWVNGSNIRFGLVAIKNVGRGFIKALVEERNRNGSFVDFYDFCKRMHSHDLNKRALEALIRCGAFDSLKIGRKTLLNSMNKIIMDISDTERRNIEGQLDLFAAQSSENPKQSEIYDYMPEFSTEELLKMEKEVGGMYFSGNPISDYTVAIKKSKAASVLSVQESIAENDGVFTDGSFIKSAGLITAVVSKTTKNGDNMAFITLEDLTGSVEIVVFPKVFTRHRELLQIGRAVAVSGKINVREDEPFKIVGNSFEALEKNAEQTEKTLYLKVLSKENTSFLKAVELIKENPGNSSVVIKFEDTSSAVKANFSVTISETMLGELKKNLGNKNVILK